MAETSNETQVKRNYKDSLFRRIFGGKENLLSLYNAVNGTCYQNAEDLKINTLDNAVYLNIKNDISFIFGFYMTLYEHQATYCANMPLRFLNYATKLIQKEVGEQSLYVSRIVNLPAPSFAVFYNGKDEKPERWTEKLSDAFMQKTTQPKLELEVLMLNVNLGNNMELMKQCRLLEEYAIYVAKVRKYADSMSMAIEDAVERAVTESINEGILADFLTRYRAEVKQISILEYDEEREMKLIRKAEYEVGWVEGRVEGRAEGMAAGVAHGKASIIVEMTRNKLLKGKTSEDIAENLELDPNTVIRITQLIKEHPQADDVEIAGLLLNSPT